MYNRVQVHKSGSLINQSSNQYNRVQNRQSPSRQCNCQDSSATALKLSLAISSATICGGEITDTCVYFRFQIRLSHRKRNRFHPRHVVFVTETVDDHRLPNGNYHNIHVCMEALGGHQSEPMTVACGTCILRMQQLTKFKSGLTYLL